MQSKDKEKKDATDEDIARAEKKLKAHDEFFRGRAFEQSLSSLANIALHAGGAEAFTNRGMDIPNIAELGEEIGSVKKEEEEEESGEDVYGREPDAKRGKWFDPDIEIQKTKRAYRNSQKKLHDALSQTVQSAKDILTLIDKQTPEDRWPNAAKPRDS